MSKEDDIIKFQQDVREMINEADPWYLIEGGAPTDEYEDYVDNIVSFIINHKPNKDQLYSMLIKIFSTKEFDIEKDKDKISLLTEKLLDLYKVYISFSNKSFS